MRTATLWKLVVVFSSVSLATGTVALHRIADFMDKGTRPNTHLVRNRARRRMRGGDHLRFRARWSGTFRRVRSARLAL